MTEMQLREILCDAMVKEYEWVPAPEDLQYDYTFSPEFEEKTLRRHSMARAKYSKRLKFPLDLPQGGRCRMILQSKGTGA